LELAVPGTYRAGKFNTSLMLDYIHCYKMAVMAGMAILEVLAIRYFEGYGVCRHFTYVDILGVSLFFCFSIMILGLAHF